VVEVQTMAYADYVNSSAQDVDVEPDAQDMGTTVSFNDFVQGKVLNSQTTQQQYAIIPVSQEGVHLIRPTKTPYIGGKHSGTVPRKDFEDTKDELTVAVANALAQAADISLEAAYTVVSGTIKDPSKVLEAINEILKPSKRFYTKSDFTEAELTGSAELDKAHNIINKHRRKRVEDLNDETKSELRRARALVRYSSWNAIKQGHPTP
jgi:hypothetical protein